MIMNHILPVPYSTDPWGIFKMQLFMRVTRSKPPVPFKNCAHGGIILLVQMVSRFKFIVVNFMRTFTALSVVLLGTADALVEFCDGVLQEVHAEDAVVVEEVGH